MAKVKDLIGQKFGRLTVIGKADYYISPKGQQQMQWLCECVCGKKLVVRATNLKSGNSKSCGCWNIEQIKKSENKNKKYPQLIYNKTTKRLLNIYRNMIRRCYDKNNERYNDWGGRGIKVCEEWLNNFISFYNWAINNGYQDNLTIDRINNNGNYEPLNCRWATYREQARNSSKNHLITYNNKTYCIEEWSEITGLTPQAILSRLRRKWSIEKTLKTKPMVNQYKFKES